MIVENWLSTIPLRMRSLFHRNRLEEELDEELRDHINRQIEENRVRGMSADEARGAALRAFGNPVALRQHTHDMWTWSIMEQLLNDLRLGVRTLVRTPSFALVSIVVMALGIGANVALFAIVKSVLLNPLPYADPSGLVRLYEHVSAGGQDSVYTTSAPGVYAEWKEQNRTLGDLAIAGSTALRPLERRGRTA